MAERALVAFFGGKKGSGAHSSPVVHISVLKRLSGAHFGARKALWCTFWG